MPGLSAGLTHLRRGQAHAALTGQWLPVETIETPRCLLCPPGR